MRHGKYNARATDSPILRRRFHSAAEARYAEHLYARQQNGEIHSLQFQKRVTLREGAWSQVMLVDFYYFDHKRDEWVYNEFKGFATPAWKRQAKIWGQCGPGVYLITYPRKNTIEPYRFEEIRPVKEAK